MRRNKKIIQKKWKLIIKIDSYLKDEFYFHFQ